MALQIHSLYLWGMKRGIIVRPLKSNNVLPRLFFLDVKGYQNSLFCDFLLLFFLQIVFKHRSCQARCKTFNHTCIQVSFIAIPN